MRIVYDLLFVFFLAITELLFVPVPFTFIVLLLWSQAGSEKKALVASFLIGFLFDSFLLRTLGTSAMLFMTIIFVAMLYKRKFQPNNLFFLGVLTFLSLHVIEFTYRGTLAFPLVILYTLLTLILARLFFKPESNYESWNRVS